VLLHAVHVLMHPRHHQVGVSLGLALAESGAQGVHLLLHLGELLLELLHLRARRLRLCRRLRQRCARAEQGGREGEAMGESVG
jgi:hypothetical protein